jgi:hypothetical protein
VPARLLSFPFRIDPSGAAATVEHGSDSEVEELLAVGVLTTPGERVQVPTFGVNDPTFTGFELGNLQRHVLDFGPRVTVQSVETARRADDREELRISWRRIGGDA